MKREPMFRRYLRFWGADPRRDVDDELEFHLAMRVAEFEQSGMSREEAERTTRDRFGDVRGVHGATRSDLVVLLPPDRRETGPDGSVGRDGAGELVDSLELDGAAKIGEVDLSGDACIDVRVGDRKSVV